jgi:hypothetical protein
MNELLAYLSAHCCQAVTCVTRDGAPLASDAACTTC